MSTDPLTIDRLACQLRKQTDLPLWAVASSSTITAISTGVAEAFGPRGRWIHALFTATGLSWFGLQALRLLTLGIVALWWVKSLKTPRCKKAPIELFIGFGAGPEQQMFDSFLREGERSVERLDQTKPATFAAVIRPSISALWRHAWNEPRFILNGLRRSGISVVKSHACEWLTSIAIRIGTYVFYKAWAERLPIDIRRIVFISPDIPAFAVIDAQKLNPGLSVEFRQHGLLRKSVLLPKFNKVLSLNKPEAAHIKDSTGCERVDTVKIRYVEQCLARKPVLLFASIYDFKGFNKEDHVESLKEIVEWVANNSLQMVVRLHPCENECFWSKHFPAVEIDCNGGGFEECLSRLSPVIAMSWFSTALIDSLKEGVLPILITSGSEQALADIVFPLDSIALKWPEELSQLETFLNEPDDYQEHVLSLQKQTFGVKAD